MSSRNGQLRRTLTVYRTADQDDHSGVPQRLEEIAEAYSADVPEPVHAQFVFEGTFGPEMPDDVDGGTGRYLCYPTRLGTLHLYAESFRGSNDAWAQLQRRVKGIEAIVDITRGFLRQELGEVEDFDKLDAFIQTRFEADMKTLEMYSWKLANTSVGAGMAWPMSPLDTDTPEPKTPQTEPAETQPGDNSPFQNSGTIVEFDGRLQMVRAALFLAERGYLTEKTVPHAVELTQEKVFEPLLHDILIRKVGLTEDSPLLSAAVQLLHRNDLVNSIHAYIRTTESWKQTARDLDLDPDTDEEKQRKVILEEWMQRTGITSATAFPLDLFGTNDEVIVRLDIDGPVVNHMTNGKITDDGKQIIWSARLPEYRECGIYDSLPLVCYGTWYTPDLPAQRKHLGKVLEGEDLVAYALWVHRLGEADRRAWQAFVSALTPQRLEELLSFTFPGQSAPGCIEHPVIRSLYTTATGNDLPEWTTQPAKRRE